MLRSEAVCPFMAISVVMYSRHEVFGVGQGAVSDVVEKLCGVVSDLFNES
jgi:hypothetical protein